MFKAFMDSFYGTENVTVNEKGNLALSTTVSVSDTCTSAGLAIPASFLDFDFKSIRGLQSEEFSRLISKAYNDSAKDVNILASLWALVFSIRDISEGKGERDLFYESVIFLSAQEIKTALAVLPYIGGGVADKIYGSYRDFSNLWIRTMYKIRSTDKSDYIENWTVFGEALVTEYSKAVQSGERGALKWAPLCRLQKKAKRKRRTEGTTTLVRYDFARALCKSLNMTASEWRKMVVEQRRHGVEQNMCKGKWLNIEPPLPAVCARKKRRAFANLSKDPKSKAEVERCEDLERRGLASKMHAFYSKVVKGKAKSHTTGIQGHEMVKAYLPHETPDSMSPSEDLAIEALFKSMIAEYRESGILGNYIPVVDVSGSMGKWGPNLNGNPLMAAIYLGIMISQCTSPAFRNRIITFESNPRWHSTGGDEWSFYQHVNNLRSAPWGGSTNFKAVLKMVLHGCVSAKLSNEVVSSLSLIILSDMQFDRAGTWGLSQIQSIRSEFQAHGYENFPKIVFWNLRGDTVGYPACAHERCLMVSGFSPAILKQFMKTGSFDKQGGQSHMALATLQDLLLSSRYEPVRKAVLGSVL